MIASFIVISSIVLALVFTIAWFTRPDLRQQVEDPKYFFQQQVKHHDKQYHESRNDMTGESDDQH